MKKKITYLAYLILAYIIVDYLTQELFYTFDVVRSTLDGVVQNNTIKTIYADLKKNWWFSLLITSVLTPVVTIFYASLCIYISFFISNIKIKYQLVLESTIKAQFVFVFAAVCKISWRYFVKIDSLYDLSIMPLSLASIFDINYMDSDNVWLSVPLNTINIFELLFLLLLPIFLKKNTDLSYLNLLKPIFYGYISGLFLYITSTIFLALTL